VFFGFITRKYLVRKEFVALSKTWIQNHANLRRFATEALNIASQHNPIRRIMSREKIKVPGKVYEELVALQREIHFTLDHQDTVKKAEDRGYMNAANWIRQNEKAYKVGFSWGFEPMEDEPHGMIRDIPEREAPPIRRTIHRAPQTIQPRSSKKSSGENSDGIFAGIKNWLGKYF
jgi:hypothetical protein